MDDYFLDIATLNEGDAALRHEDPERGPGWLCFSQPRDIVMATRPVDVETCLTEAARHGESNWTVGFLTYEAAAGLGAEFAVYAPDWPVRIWFARYDRPPTFHRELVPIYAPVELSDMRSEWNEEEYGWAFARVKAALAAGETYQVNLTFRQRFRLAGFPLPSTAAELFASRCGVDPPPYATFIHGGEWQMASFSPERLIERRGETVVSTPMKGTAIAGVRRADTARTAEAMASDPKSIAENIMVVDMVRNDLGRVCETGSLEIPQLLSVERHRGLLQMVSSVRGRCAAPTEELIRAVFPAASITGAPKTSTMRLIRDLEPSPRHVYCGAIGVMSPGWQRFSVAIRTALLRDGEGEFGVGSGVVWDSDAASEYAECLAKRDRLLRPAAQWALVEAMRGRSLGDPAAIAAHLARLDEQAHRFGIPLDVSGVRDELMRLFGEGRVTVAGERAKVRIVLRLDGSWSVGVGPSAIAGDAVRAVLASRPVCSADPNLRIKSTSRAVLDGHLDEHPDFDEVLLYNEHGIVTEFCRGNVVVRLDGELRTPRPDSGALAGLGVAALIESARAAYADIPVGHLPRASEVWFVNSVVGMVAVDLVVASLPAG